MNIQQLIAHNDSINEPFYQARNKAHREKFLAHCIHLATIDKAYSWWAAKNYATLYPQELSDLPEFLTQEMKARQRSSLQVIEGGKSESSTHRR